jgi:hypothetical protein
MKDLPHHMKKLNRRVIRSMHREELEEELPSIPTWPDSPREKKKKAKNKMKQETLSRPTSDRSPEERNRIMKKGRVPIFDRNNAKPKHARASKKKTPRI